MSIKQNLNGDHFTFSYSFYWLLFFLPFIILTFFPGADGTSILFFFLSIPIGGVLALCFLVIFITHLWNKRWQKAGSVIVSPFTGIAILLFLDLTHIPLWVYLQVHKPVYLEQIAKAHSAKDKPVIKSFHVGGWGWAASASGTLDIIYDESDQMATYSKTHPCASVIKLEKHFYYSDTVESGCNFSD